MALKAWFMDDVEYLINGINNIHFSLATPHEQNNNIDPTLFRSLRASLLIILNDILVYH